MKKKGLSELGEFGLIERIRSQVGTTSSLRLGIGDDCSIQTIDGSLEILTSTDLLIEGVHFNLSWTDLTQLGRKSVAVNVSDIAAMGGTPRSLYLGIAVPPNLSIEDLDLFIHGFVSAAKEYGAVLAGGDTCRSSGPLIISVTVQGEVRQGRGVTRSGADSGDLVFVSGSLGDSALALKLLQDGEQPAAELAERHHCPQARVSLGCRLAESGLASAMIDVSDGLVADLGHLITASAKGAIVQLEKIPLSPFFQNSLPGHLERMELALTGGEDYELLFTSAAQNERNIEQLADELNLSLSCIGKINDDGGLQVLQEDGSLYPYRHSGFDHFSK